VDGRAVSTARRAPGTGLVDRMARTWTAPRRATRFEIDMADEARLLFYAFAASLLGTLAAVAGQRLNPAPGVAGDQAQWTATQVTVGLFVRPIGLYLAAALIGFAARAAGGTGGWRDTRAAVFWTALVAAPAGVVLTAVGAFAAAYGGAAGAGPAGAAAGSVIWAALLAPALAEAHGFRSALGVFAVMMAGSAAIAAAVSAL
jgi:hypothetical protein